MPRWALPRRGNRPGGERTTMFSIFDYTDGVFQLNVWGFVLAILIVGAVAAAGNKVRKQ